MRALIGAAGRARRRRAGFTLVEMLVVVAIVGLLAALITGLAGRASDSKIRKRAEVERDALVMAIENYKSKLGYYPQDGYNGATPPSVSPLYNELTKNRIPDAFANQMGIADIANMGPKSEAFLTSLKANQFKELGKGPRADTSGEFVAGQLIYPYGEATWHFNASSPTNNPGAFDLWVEVTIGNKKHVIGNWKD